MYNTEKLFYIILSKLYKKYNIIIYMWWKRDFGEWRACVNELIKKNNINTVHIKTKDNDIFFNYIL